MRITKYKRGGPRKWWQVPIAGCVALVMLISSSPASAAAQVNETQANREAEVPGIVEDLERSIEEARRNIGWAEWSYDQVVAKIQAQGQAGDISQSQVDAAGRAGQLTTNDRCAV